MTDRTIEAVRPTTKLLEEIALSVQNTPHTTRLPSGGRVLRDAPKTNKLERDVALRLRQEGYDFVHSDRLQGLYTLAYFDFKASDNPTEPLETPSGQTFWIVDGAVKQIDSRSAQWMGELNGAIVKEIGEIASRTEREVLERKSLLEKKPNEIPSDVREEIKGVVGFALSSRRSQIATNPVGYATNILKPPAPPQPNSR